MTNHDILARCARREITPEQAARLMLAADREAWTARRPRWCPAWAWRIVDAVHVHWMR